MMIRILLILQLCFLVFLQGDKSLTFDITKDVIEMHSTIYATGGCTLQRTFEKTIPYAASKLDEDGSQASIRVTFTNIESSADFDSISFKGIFEGSDDGNLVINEVSHETERNYEQKELIEEKIFDLQSTKKVLQAEIKIIEGILRLFVTAIEKTSLLGYKLFKTALNDYIGERGIHIGQITGKKKEIEEVEQKISNLENDIREIENIIKIHVDFSIDKQYATKWRESNDKNGKNVKMILSYNVKHEASWSPSYVLRIDSSTGNSKIDYFANIEQSTGVYWNRTRITLSDSSLSAFQKPPTLSPMRIGLTKNPSPSKKGKRRFGFPEEPTIVVASFESFAYNKNDDGAKPRAITDVTVFEMDKRISLGFIQASIKVSVTDPFDIESDFLHHLFPQQSTKTYVKMIGMHKFSDFNLLPGPMNIIVDGKFTAKTSIDETVFINSELVNWIGTDALIKIKKLPIKSKKFTSGILSTTFNEVKTVECMIENKKDIHVNLTVIDALPFPTNKNIKVFLEKPFAMKKPIYELISDDVNVRKGVKLNGENYNANYDDEGSYIRKVRNENGRLDIYKINKENMLERNIILKPHSKRSLVLQYRIEWQGANNYYVK